MATLPHMSSEAISIARRDWPAVTAAFREFFEPIGDVSVSSDELEFASAITGLAIRRNGTSRSFMPLHSLEAAWETIVFDHDGDEVKLIGDGATYTYRVPPQLRR